MKYHKYIEGKGSDRCFRVHFRIVFAGLISETKCRYYPFINTGSSTSHFFKFFHPKRNIRRNYKMLFREYRAWNGVEE